MLPENISAAIEYWKARQSLVFCLRNFLNSNRLFSFSISCYLLIMFVLEFGGMVSVWRQAFAQVCTCQKKVAVCFQQSFVLYPCAHDPRKMSAAYYQQKRDYCYFSQHSGFVIRIALHPPIQKIPLCHSRVWSDGTNQVINNSKNGCCQQKER